MYPDCAVHCAVWLTAGRNNEHMGHAFTVCVTATGACHFCIYLITQTCGSFLRDSNHFVAPDLERVLIFCMRNPAKKAE